MYYECLNKYKYLIYLKSYNKIFDNISYKNLKI